MRADDNWKETKLLTEDLENLLGVPSKISKEYLEIIENLLIHKFIEQLNEQDLEQDTDYQIELPYLGSLIISINEKQKITTDFVVKSSFYKKIKAAYITRESPLVSQCGSLLGEVLAAKYVEEEGEHLE